MLKNIRFGQQFCENNSGQVILHETTVTFEKALDLIFSFPWATEKEKFTKREEGSLTSSFPGIYLYANSKHFFHLYNVPKQSFDEEGFNIEVVKDNLIFEYFIYDNISKSNSKYTIEELLEGFYNEEIEKYIEGHEIDSVETTKITLETFFNKQKFLLQLIIPFLPFILLFTPSKEPFFFQNFSLVASILLVVYNYPILYLKYHYWSNDKSQKIEFKNGNKEISIIKEGKMINLLKEEIYRIDYVNPFNDRNHFRDFSYIKFYSKKIEFAITHLSYPSEHLLEMFKINYFKIDFVFPRIHLRDVKDLIELNSSEKERSLEIEKRYLDMQIQELENIIDNASDYEPFALKIAEKILHEKNFGGRL